MSFFDNFTLSQSNNSTLSSDGSFTNSDRGLSQIIPTFSLTIASGSLTVSLSSPIVLSNPLGSLAYNFSTVGNIDLSGIFMIFLPRLSGDISSVTLRVTDNLFNSMLINPNVATFFTFDLTTASGVDLTQVRSIVFNFFGPASGDTVFGPISSTLVCLAKDTLVLMANDEHKLIQNITRGDQVKGYQNRIFTVSRLLTQTIDDQFPSDIVVFEKDSLGHNLPSQNFVITGSHPLIWNKKRRPAKCFSELPNITRYYQGKKYFLDNKMNQDNKIYYNKDLLPMNDKHTFTLYDLQFETLGNFFANGILVQSRSPRSDITPLPKELYFHHELYRSDNGEDDTEYEFPLDFTLLDLIE